MKTAPLASILAVLFVGFTTFMLSCTSTKATADVQQIVVQEGSVSITQQDVYPGAQGPVRMVRTYTANFTADINVPVTQMNLLVDSMQYAITRLKINGVSADGQLLAVGDGQQITLTASRSYPIGNKAEPLGFGNGAFILESANPLLSGKQLNGTAELRALIGPSAMDFPLGQVEILQDIYAP